MANWRCQDSTDAYPVAVDLLPHSQRLVAIKPVTIYATRLIPQWDS